MCTTYLLTEIIREFSELDIIRYPRLVRLNPMIPWKTRGNGALAIRLGRGAGKKKIVGYLGGVDIWGYEKENTCIIDIPDIIKRMSILFDKFAQFDANDTNPAFVISQKKMPTFF